MGVAGLMPYAYRDRRGRLHGMGVLGDYATVEPEIASAIGLQTCNQSDPGAQNACSQSNQSLLDQYYSGTGVGVDPSTGVPYMQEIQGENPQQSSESGAEIAAAVEANPTQYGYTPATAQTLAQTYGLPTTGGSKAPSANATVTLSNLSRPGQSFQSGDSFRLSISGAAPNSPVSASSTQNGVSQGTNSFGSTDGSGNFSTTGTFYPTNVGTWQETWTVGGQNVGNVSFSVGPAGGAPVAASSTLGPVTAPVTAAVPSVAASAAPSSTFDWSSIPWWGWAGGAAVLLLLFSGGGKR